MPEETPGTTAVQLAELTGMVRQVISDHERRLTMLENKGMRTAAVMGPIVGVAGLLIGLAAKLPWA